MSAVTTNTSDLPISTWATAVVVSNIFVVVFLHTPNSIYNTGT